MVVPMVTRRRLRTVLTTLGLYLGAALLIGYFDVNAYTGNHGINARQGLDVQMARLATERDTLRSERQQWERRVALLKSQSLDPDMLDERARALLDYVDARDLTLMVAAGRTHAAANLAPDAVYPAKAIRLDVTCAFTPPGFRLRGGRPMA